MKRLGLLIAVGILSAGANTASAQQIIDPLDFTISPEMPGPNQEVIIEVRGIGSFLGNSTITWKRDSRTELSGVGERLYTFTAGGVGKQTRIDVTVNSTEQGVIERTFTFTPSVVHLFYEAETSVPPLYRGKALYSPGSRVKVIALPSIVSGGTSISSNNLSFQWQHNNEPVASASGLGRNTYTFRGDQLRKSETVAVDVYWGGIKAGQASLSIPAIEPKILLYPRDPLREVLYENAFPNSISLGAREITLQAEPYYFSRESVGSTLAYSWRLDGNTIIGPDSERGTLTLRQSGAGAGEARVEVSAQNIASTQFLQSAKQTLQIVFGASSNQPSLFGI